MARPAGHLAHARAGGTESLRDSPDAASADALPNVRLEGVTKAFGDFVAVRELDLAIEQGGFFTLLGPSGCGKTTTLRMIAGFEQPTAGRIEIDGDDVAGLPAYKRPTNTVFQSYALFPHLNVFENVAFGLRRKGVAKDEARGRVEAELERVGLAGEIKHRPNQLSGGQQQRVAIARALVNEPKIVFADEPTGNLDSHTGEAILNLFRTLSEQGRTIALVTHDPEIAAVTPRRIEIRDGKIAHQVDAKLAGLDRLARVADVQAS